MSAVPVAEVLQQLDHRELLRVRGAFTDDEREDARGEFYLALLEGRARWSGRGSLRAWAKGVAGTIATNRRMRARERAELLERFGGLSLCPAAAEQADEVADRRFHLRLLERLRPVPRRALELQLLGLSNEAIAAHLGVTEHAVEGLVKRARAKLKELEADPAARCGRHPDSEAAA